MRRSRWLSAGAHLVAPAQNQKKKEELGFALGRSEAFQARTKGSGRYRPARGVCDQKAQIVKF